MSKKQYAKRIPLSVKGGIRAQSSARTAGRVWWCQRWLEILEGFRLGARLGRGRGYAVAGQVSNLEISAGVVKARVQGVSERPYSCEITFKTLEPETKELLLKELHAQPMLVARLLVSDLPTAVEKLFRLHHHPLFPQRRDDLVNKCDCPDYANPCKHLAAVYCLLGEQITHTPLLLLALRGISRIELIGADACPSERGITDLLNLTPPRELPPPRKPSIPAPLIRRLGPLPFWRGGERFMETMEHLYERAAARGWRVWSGQPLDLRREDEKVIVKGANLQLKRRLTSTDTSWL